MTVEPPANPTCVEKTPMICQNLRSSFLFWSSLPLFFLQDRQTEKAESNRQAESDRQRHKDRPRARQIGEEGNQRKVYVIPNATITSVYVIPNATITSEINMRPRRQLLNSPQNNNLLLLFFFLHQQDVNNRRLSKAATYTQQAAILPGKENNTDLMIVFGSAQLGIFLSESS